MGVYILKYLSNIVATHTRQLFNMDTKQIIKMKGVTNIKDVYQATMDENGTVTAILRYPNGAVTDITGATDMETIFEDVSNDRFIVVGSHIYSPYEGCTQPQITMLDILNKYNVTFTIKGTWSIDKMFDITYIRLRSISK